MRKILLSVVSAVMLMGVAGSAAAADASLKIGIVDMQQIIQKSPQLATINDQLNKQFKARQDKVIAAQKNLQAETDKYNRNSATMSSADRTKAQDQITADHASTQSMMVDFQRDLNTAQNQAMQTLIGQVTGVVSKIAKAGNYDLILQRAAAPYANNDMDITDQVLAGMK